jgi:hypothetical protein
VGSDLQDVAALAVLKTGKVVAIYCTIGDFSRAPGDVDIMSRVNVIGGEGVNRGKVGAAE